MPDKQQPQITPSQQAQSAAPSTSGVDAIALLQNAGGWGNQATLDLVGATHADSTATVEEGSGRVQATQDRLSMDELAFALHDAHEDLEERMERRAQELRVQPAALGAIAGSFGEAASRGVRSILPVAAATVGGPAASAIAGLVAPRVGNRVGSRMAAYGREYEDGQVLAGDPLQDFLELHARAWRDAFVDSCKKSLTTEDRIEAFFAVLKEVVERRRADLIAGFQTAILEPFLRLGASLPCSTDAFGQPSGVYNFTVEYTDDSDGVRPITLGMPAALGVEDSRLLVRARGLWRSQVFELVSADGSLTALVSAGRAEIVRVEPVAREALQVRGFGDAEVVRELRHRASRGDPDASGALGEYEQRGVQAIWDDLLASVGDAAFAEVDDLRILTHA